MGFIGEDYVEITSQEVFTIIPLSSHSKGAFTTKAKLFFASPKTREFTRSTIHRVLTMSVETLREGRGLSPCLVGTQEPIGPELRDDRLKVEIFQLGAKIAPLKTRHCQHVGHIASPGKISRLSQPQASVR